MMGKIGSGAQGEAHFDAVSPDVDPVGTDVSKCPPRKPQALGLPLADPIETKRRLAAIFAADVEGYSRLMGADEVATLEALTARRVILDGLIATHRGRIANTAGDSVLAEFGSAVDAVRCAMEAQGALAEANSSLPESRHINFRMGVHVGDVMVRAGDLFGDGVNIAARLQTLARAGGLCVSGVAYDQVRKILPLEFTDLGAQTVKNIEEPIRAYEVRPQGEVAPSGSREVSMLFPGTKKPLTLPDKPSIAVLPFQNMSGDPEQEYFADGMVEDIITALSRFKSLFVIARNSSFTYKSKHVDIKQVGRELGVRYVLEGSVRKAGGRVRITGQLIDSETGAHLWADRFEGVLEDVFELQDQVTMSVVGELISQVQFVEVDRAIRKPTASLDAYDCYLQGLANIWKWTKTTNEAAQAYFGRAIDLDENFAVPHAFAGHIYVLRKQSRWTVDVAQENAAAIRLSRRAIELGQGDALALALSGFNLAYIADELDVGAECIARGLSMNTNLAMGWGFSGWVQVYLGKHETALEHLRQAERLSPRDPTLIQLKAAAALAHFFNGGYEEAARLAERITGDVPTFLPGWRIMAISCALAGYRTLADKAAKKVLELDPSAKVSVLVPLLPIRRPEDRERYKEGLLQAGLPQ
jgi:TolB-like protein/class 3 adenylate cyclase